MFSLFLLSPPLPMSHISLAALFFHSVFTVGRERGVNQDPHVQADTGWIFVLLSHRVNKCPCSNTFSRFISQGLCTARTPLHSHTPGLSSLSLLFMVASILRGFPSFSSFPGTQSPPKASCRAGGAPQVLSRAKVTAGGFCAGFSPTSIGLFSPG